ncbi:MAG: hypothetical protein LVR00_05360 [Rhabdochlamydiaceae bacterium]|jgi:hypothetical protein
MKIENYQISPSITGLLNQSNLQNLPSTQPTTEEEWVDLIWKAYDEYVSGSFPGNRTPQQTEAINNIKNEIENEIGVIHKLFEEYGFLPSITNISKIHSLIISIYAIEGRKTDFPKIFTNELYGARSPLDTDLFNLRETQIKEFEKDIISTLTTLELFLATSTSLTDEQKEKLVKSIENLNNQLSQLTTEKNRPEKEVRDGVIALAPSFLNSMTEALKNGKNILDEIKAGNNSVSGDFPMNPSKEGFDTSIPRKKTAL